MKSSRKSSAPRFWPAIAFVGVTQISRKGANPQLAGPDFTSDDLGKVLSLCTPLGKLLQRTISD